MIEATAICFYKNTLKITWSDHLRNGGDFMISKCRIFKNDDEEKKEKKYIYELG